jgi:hypothetical protein
MGVVVVASVQKTQRAGWHCPGGLSSKAWLLEWVVTGTQCELNLDFFSRCCCSLFAVTWC